MNISDRTNELILAIQTASPTLSHPPLPYAKAAWDELEPEGQAAALAELPGNIAAVYELNKGLVISYAKRWRGAVSTIESADDIMRAAECGYIASLYRFDMRRGLKHSTFAFWVMQNEILKELLGLMPFGQPGDIANAARAVRRVVEEYEAEHGHRPTTDAIVELTGLKPRAVRAVQLMPELMETEADGDTEADRIEDHPAPETTESIAEKRAALETAEAVHGEHWRDVVHMPIYAEMVRVRL